MKRALCILVVACAGACQPAPQPTNTNDRAVLDSVRREIEAAENAGDADRMYAHMAPDAVGMAPNMPAVAGADANREGLRQFFSAFTVNIAYKSEEVVFDRDWAFDRGTAAETLTPKTGGPPIRTNYKYLWLYQRVNGAWKQARVIWNSSDPPPNAPPPVPSQPK